MTNSRQKSISLLKKVFAFIYSIFILTITGCDESGAVSTLRKLKLVDGDSHFIEKTQPNKFMHILTDARKSKKTEGKSELFLNSLFALKESSMGFDSTSHWLEKENITRWLTFLAYMEVGKDFDTFVKYPLLQHALMGVEEVDDVRKVNGACGLWGITPLAIVDTLTFMKEKDVSVSHSVLEIAREYAQKGIPLEYTVTAVYYPLVASSYRNVQLGLVRSPCNPGIYTHAYSSYYTPKEDRLDENQKKRILRWFDLSSSTQSKYSL